MAAGVRRTGRELAVKIIYSLENVAMDVEQALDSFWTHFRFRDDVLGEPLDNSDAPLPGAVVAFSQELVRGVNEHLERIDEVIDQYATNWSLERMARVDLAILRVAAFELLFRADVPVSVVINEAVEIGKRYGTRETPAFVNGILDRISRSCRKTAP
jgi:N utilization substance protein B